MPLKANHCKAKQCKATNSNAKQRNATQCEATQSIAHQNNAKQSNAKQSNAMPSNSKQSQAKHSKAMQSKAMQTKAKPSNANQTNAKQCKAKKSKATQCTSKQCKEMQSQAIRSQAMQSKAQQCKALPCSTVLPEDAKQSSAMEKTFPEKQSKAKTCQSKPSSNKHWSWVKEEYLIGVASVSFWGCFYICLWYFAYLVMLEHMVSTHLNSARCLGNISSTIQHLLRPCMFCLFACWSTIKCATALFNISDCVTTCAQTLSNCSWMCDWMSKATFDKILEVDANVLKHAVCFTEFHIYLHNWIFRTDAQAVLKNSASGSEFGYIPRAYVCVSAYLCTHLYAHAFVRKGPTHVHSHT